MVKSVWVEGRVVIRYSGIIVCTGSGVRPLIDVIPSLVIATRLRRGSNPFQSSYRLFRPPKSPSKPFAELPNALFAKQFIGCYFTKIPNHSLTRQNLPKHFASPYEGDNRGWIIGIG